MLLPVLLLLPALAAASCDGCRGARETQRQRHLAAIKDEILRRMGFARAPNITGKSLPPVPAEFVERLGLDMQGDEGFRTGVRLSEEEDDYHVKTQQVLTFAQAYPRLRHSWKGQEVLHFTFSDSITKFHVANATLHVFLKGDNRRPQNTVHFEVFKVRRNTDNHQLVRVVNKFVKQPTGIGDWIQVDFTETIGEWFKNSRENFGFVVNATVDGKKVASTEVDGKTVPYVEISTTESKRRVRRNLGLNCDDKMNEPLCCRYPLTVDFEEIGFDFIIAPKRYEAHMCSGECPYVTLQKYAHTHLMRMASPNSAAPCCAPRKVSAISMLYFDEQLNVVYGSLPGMVVDRCGCS